MIWSDSRPVGAVGMIAGGGEFPILLARAAMGLGRSLTVFGINGLTDRRLDDYAAEVHYVELGHLGRVLELLREKKIRQVVLAGSVPKKRLFDPGLKLDREADGLLKGAPNKGDDHLLKALEVVLRLRCGAKVLDTRKFLKDALASKGFLTQRRPDVRETRDLELGLKVARHIGKMDIGQTVLVKDGVVVAVEALEGTDQAIRRAGELAGAGLVMVKAAKPNQSLLFDLPCVGLDTVDRLVEAGCRTLGVEAGRTIMISKEQFLQACERKGLTVVGL